MMDSAQTIGEALQGRYEILSTLGEGGFGTVYKARQVATGQSVALKVLRLPEGAASPSNEKRIARFQREMQICAQMHHPNIVRLMDSGHTGTVVYSVFEFVPGKNLAEVIAEEGRIDPGEARYFMMQALDALACAHAAGVVHRDLKPANIMIVPTGARRNALVLDFGIGALTQEARQEEGARITLTNESIGTPSYAAPEQLRNQPLTPRSDLYAWGLCFVECLTGKRVIDGDTVAEVVYKQLSPDPVPIPDVIADHPLGRILRRATAKDPAQRDTSAEGLLRELEGCDLRDLRMRITGPVRIERAPADAATATVQFSSAPAPERARLVEGERRQITALCCNLVAVGSGAKPADMEELDHVLGVHQEVCADIARRHGGYVAGALGDSVLSYFGYPSAREDDAARAARAALAILAEVGRRSAALEEERRIRLELRVGLHTGLVVARELRDAGSSLGFVVGSTPKLAARLAGLAEPGSVLVSGSTQRLLRRRFVLDDSGLRVSDDSTSPVEVFALREGDPSDLRELPLVGRDREMETLLDRWRKVRGGAGQAVLVTGEPGIGKSRMARELAERIGDEPHVWLECRATPDSANSAFYPIADLLDRMLDPRREVKPDGKVSKLEALLSLYGFELGEAMPLFAPLLSLSLPARFAPLDVSPQKKRELTRNAVLSLLFEMAEKEPVALVIEDLHWADPSTVELLGQLVGEVGSARVLALFTTRPELTASWASSTAVLQLQLGRLGRPEVELMATKVTGDRALPNEVLEMIAGRTDGVPLFVEELIRTMIESGALVEHEGRYVLAKPLSEVSIPSTLRDSLVARLDRLGRAKETAQVAAAIGREFTFDLLRAVTPFAEAEAQEDLDRLVFAELVYRKRRLKNPAYIFKHALVRDAAYESMLKRSRREVHARIAKALEEKFPEVAGERPDLLAHHHAGADQKKEAIGYAQKASRAGLGRSAYAEAAEQVRQALPWTEALEGAKEKAAAELELSMLMMPALMALGGAGDARLVPLTGRILELCDALDASPHRLPTLYALTTYHHIHGNRAQAEALARRLVALAAEAGDAAPDVAGHAILAQCLVMSGRYEEARAAAERAVRGYDPEKHRATVLAYGVDLRTFAHSMLGYALGFLGDLDRAAAEVDRAVAWGRELNLPNMVARSLFFAALVHRLRDDPARTIEVTKESMEIADRYGLPFSKAWAGMFHGWATRDVAQIKRIVDANEARGEIVCRVFLLSMLAEAEASHGQIAEALGHLEDALRFSEEQAEHMFVPGVLRQKGALLLQQDAGALDAAEACQRRALALARAQRARTEELGAAVELARLLRTRGQAKEARETLSAVYAGFTEGLDTRPLIEARTLLDELEREEGAIGKT